MKNDPLKNIPKEEKKKLSDLFKTLKFTKKTDLAKFKDHEEIKMLFDFLENSSFEDLKNFGRYLRLLQEHENEHEVSLFVEYYIK